MCCSKIKNMCHIYIHFLVILLIWPRYLWLNGVSARNPSVIFHNKQRVQKIINQSSLPKRGSSHSSQHNVNQFIRRDTLPKMVYFGGPLVFKMDIFPIFYGDASFQSQLLQFYNAIVQNSSFFYGRRCLVNV